MNIYFIFNFYSPGVKSSKNVIHPFGAIHRIGNKHFYCFISGHFCKISHYFLNISKQLVFFLTKTLEDSLYR